MSALETATETLRTTLAAIRKLDSGWAEKVIPNGIIELYVNSRPDYRLTEEQRKAAMQQAGKDGFWLLDQIAATGSAEMKVLAEVATMTKVWEQRYERVEGDSRLREKLVDSNELIITPHDTGVRAGEKRGKKWHGEKVHVTETAEKGEPNFITDVTTVKASSGDSAGLTEVREHLERQEVMPGEQYVDAGYVSGKQMKESEAAGISLLGPPLPDTSAKEFKIADFRIDREAQQAK